MATTTSTILSQIVEDNSIFTDTENITTEKGIMNELNVTETNIFQYLNDNQNNISSTDNTIPSSLVFLKDKPLPDYDIPTTISAEKLHSLIIQGDKELANDFLCLFMKSPTLTEYLSRILIKNTEAAMERLRIMQLNNELTTSFHSSGYSSPATSFNNTIFETSQCSSPSTEIALSITSDISSETSIYEEVVNEVLMESTTTVTQDEYEAILGMLHLKNSTN
uniref:DMA domain-containing protein n=1 Tax=Parastrongyloides trichosuri TaxID=131310 RepID=A0A0N5A2J7_PARTI